MLYEPADGAGSGLADPERSFGFSSSSGAASAELAQATALGAHSSASQRSSVKTPSSLRCSGMAPGGAAFGQDQWTHSPCRTPTSTDFPSVLVRNFRSSRMVWPPGTSSMHRTTMQHLRGHRFAAATCAVCKRRLSSANHARFPRIWSPLTSLAASPSLLRIFGSHEITRMAGKGGMRTRSNCGGPSAASSLERPGTRDGDAEGIVSRGAS
mmetsp:Transcript_72387/g.212407  ORF Transcript_72387/g.212407 Transcript_72387/m.212407 type:complete len:211 (-) Transcript_72387:214-846(-)